MMMTRENDDEEAESLLPQARVRAAHELAIEKTPTQRSPNPEKTPPEKTPPIP